MTFMWYACHMCVYVVLRQAEVAGCSGVGNARKLTGGLQNVGSPAKPWQRAQLRLQPWDLLGFGYMLKAGDINRRVYPSVLYPVLQSMGHSWCLSLPDLKTSLCTI